MVHGDDVPHLLVGMDLEGGVLLHVDAVVGGHVAPAGPDPKQILVGVERCRANADVPLLVGNAVAHDAVNELEFTDEVFCKGK